MEEGTCLFPEQALLNATTLGQKFSASQPWIVGFSFAEQVYGHGVEESVRMR